MKIADLMAGFRPLSRHGPWQHPWGALARVLDPVIAAAAGAALIFTAGFGFAAFGVLVACVFLAYQLLTRAFGVNIALHPDVLRQYGWPNPPA